MKIVFDNIIFSLQHRGGGVSVVWQELLSRFISSRYDDLTFIEHPTDLVNPFRKKLNCSEGKIVTKKPCFFTLERYMDPKMKYNEPFIFHSSYFRMCSNKNAINITTVHDFTYDYYYKDKLKGAFLHLWQRNRAIRKSDAVVCISENTKRDLLKLVPDVNPQKVYVIYNGVSEDYYVVENKISGLENYLLYVGGRGYYKNGRWFANAIKETEYKILFCGAPMTIDEKAYYDQVLGPDRYEIRTDIPNEELNRIYNSVKCLVYPSSYEGFGIPVLEAQKAGCPVIALNATSIPEVIGETPLLMKELSKEELLKKITLLDDETIRKDVINQGLCNAKKYSWDKAYKEYHSLYEKLMVKHK